MVNNGNDCDIESALTSVPDYIESSTRQSTRNYTKQVLYPGQIAYGSGPLPKANMKAPKAGLSSSSTNFVSSCMAKSYEHIV